MKDFDFTCWLVHLVFLYMIFTVFIAQYPTLESIALRINRCRRLNTEFKKKIASSCPQPLDSLLNESRNNLVFLVKTNPSAAIRVIV